MIYIIYFTFLEFVAIPTEAPNQFKVESRKVSKEMMFTRRDEAEANYAKTQALAPWNRWEGVTLDSFTICKPPAKVNKNKP